MLSRLQTMQRAAHNADMNKAPLSDVMMAGTQKQEIQRSP
jgi:hypothetical protein